MLHSKDEKMRIERPDQAFWLMDFGANKKDHVYKGRLNQQISFSKTFENFSHAVLGLVGSNLWVIIMR